MHNAPTISSSSDWLSGLVTQLNTLDWAQLRRSQYRLHCRTLRNRTTLLHPINLWRHDPLAFEWLQTFATSNGLQLREDSGTSTKGGTDSTTVKHNQTKPPVTALGLDLLLQNHPDPAGKAASTPLLNHSAIADLASIVRLSSLAQQNGQHSLVPSNAFIHPTTDTNEANADSIDRYTCTFVGEQSRRQFSYYSTTGLNVAHYSVEHTQLFDVLIGGGQSTAKLATRLSRLAGESLEFEIFCAPGVPAIGILRASYSRQIVNPTSAPCHETSSPQEQSAAVAH